MCLDADGGVATIFPILFPSRSFGFFLHSTITAFFAFNTIVNFMFAAFIPAGPPPSIEWGQVEKVNRGGLENYKFCSHCQRPKHPAAHHCRTCRACVMEMDHHCPFVCEHCLHASCFFLRGNVYSCRYTVSAPPTRTLKKGTVEVLDAKSTVQSFCHCFSHYRSKSFSYQTLSRSWALGYVNSFRC